MANYPTSEEHAASTGRRLEIQTDKEKYKIVPCTFAGCDTDLVVNTFYAPAKGKCEAHSGKSAKVSVAASLVHQTEAAPAKPNGNLAQLLCPLCELPMTLIRIDESTGHLTFRCTDGTGDSIQTAEQKSGTYCLTSVTVKPRYGGLEMKQIPNRFQALVEDLNLTQKVEYFDIKEQSNARGTEGT